MHRRTILFVLIAVMAGGIILRLAYLTADPPTSAPFSYSILGAPARYTSGARQMVLFNSPALGEDRFFALSPLGTGLNYLIYKIFGIDFTTYRALPVFFSVLCLLGFVWLAYHYLDPMVGIITAIFLAFNHPLIIYSKAANRLFPMLFFFIISLWLYLKGIEKKKLSLFVLSAACFFLSFLSRGSFLHMILLFIILGLIQVRKKKISMRHLLVFGATLFILMVAWFMVIYLPNREIINAVLADNRQLRAVDGLGRFFYNILHFTFFSGFRSDLVMPVAALFSIFVISYGKLKARFHLPLLLQASLLWLAIGVLFHLPFSYSPLRFIVDLAFPASLMAGWGLCEWWRSPLHGKRGRDCIRSLALVAAAALLLGLLPLLAILPLLLKETFYFLILMLCLLVIAAYQLSMKRSAFKKTVLALLLMLSLTGNLSHFFRWVGNRKYQAVHISSVLKSALAPTTICGWFSGLVVIGTPHRDTMVWNRGINWHPDYLKKSGVEFLLLKDDFPERSHLEEMFENDINHAKRVAIFKLSHSSYYLLDIRQGTKRVTILEAESFKREAGQVVYGSGFSQKMAVLLTRWKYQDVQLEREFGLPDGGKFIFFIQGRGEARMEIVLLDSSRRHQPREVYFKGENTQAKAVVFTGLPRGPAKLLLKVELFGNSFILDKIRLQRDSEGRL